MASRYQQLPRTSFDADAASAAAGSRRESTASTVSSLLDLAPNSPRRRMVKWATTLALASTAVVAFVLMHEQLPGLLPSEMGGTAGMPIATTTGTAASGEAGGWIPSAAELEAAHNHPSYRVFRAGAAHKPMTTSPTAPVLAVPTLPRENGCLESWLGEGRLGEGCEIGGAATLEPKLDAVWTWVNGSDPLWHDQYIHYSSNTRLPKGWGPPPLRHYRNKDELRHSLRAAFKAMDGRIRTFHLVLGDWALESAEESGGDLIEGGGETKKEGEEEEKGEKGEWRLGQVPSWLDQEILGIRETATNLTVQIHHHSDIFVDRTIASDDKSAQAVYRSEALPNFDSFAIESQLVNIPGLAPHFIYLNDDFFLSDSHSRADWVSPIFGPVMRFTDPKGLVPWNQQFPETACVHEWSALLRSNWLMSHRFGHKGRVGLEHIPKTQSRAMLNEVAEIWAKDYSLSSRRRFRETDAGTTPESRIGDIHAIWMAALLLVERSRESMLWSWAVARLANAQGNWDASARAEIASVFDINEEADAAREVVVVSRLNRKTRPTMRSKEDVQKTFEGVGMEPPKQVTLTWSSLDGPLPNNGATVSSCSINLLQCFGDFWTSSTDSEVDAGKMFARLAFARPECGDCLLSALINKSGAGGLSALLPPAGKTFSTLSSSLKEKGEISRDGEGEAQQKPRRIPHMPLTSRWEDTDFSLDGVVAGDEEEVVELRAWCLEVIARYQYSLGHQSMEFVQAHFTEDLTSSMKKLESESISTLVLNDDLEGTDWQIEEATGVMKRWLETLWPESGWWERAEEVGGGKREEEEEDNH